MSDKNIKSFWSRPEGVTGVIFLLIAVGLIGYGLAVGLASILAFMFTTIGAFISLMVLGVVLFLALDRPSRALTSYVFKSAMRWITSLFVEIDPMGILKNYVEELKSNLTKMTRQIHQLRGQMHKLNELVYNNKKEIESNLTLANQAATENQKAQMLLKSRKAGRLKDSNIKLEDLYNKMGILYKILTKMHENSHILVEDIQDQVMVKEQELKAIQASNSAMKSAMNVIKGDPDKRQLFDDALESIADDVALKVGEMERFMEVSEGFMQSIDLQNGVFEEEGLKMLEKWEQESTSLLLGEYKSDILEEMSDKRQKETLTVDGRQQEKYKSNHYDNLFE